MPRGFSVPSFGLAAEEAGGLVSQLQHPIDRRPADLEGLRDPLERTRTTPAATNKGHDTRAELS
jgi:hypothetical protein